ncbi:protein of unknown function [Paraburkholderia dioscoreae]|uniref:Uncharacterized protein n=1 Tax=Paraburkholderia dioscoreae TaxID=2604047 RepID=A0A5Q4ZI27_9BURK|nr:protein of unknown function [Paraburkholderia dioscoreae]
MRVSLTLVAALEPAQACAGFRSLSHAASCGRKAMVQANHSGGRIFGRTVSATACKRHRISQGRTQKAKTREAEGYAGFMLLFVVGAKGFEPSTL